MATIAQRAIVLDSQNQIRKADSLAREWAIAHAGAHQGQARRALGGSDPFREWRDDNLTIRIAKLVTDSYKQVQLCSVRYQHSPEYEPYSAYIMTFASSEPEQAGGHCIAVSAAPDAWLATQLPWDDKTGPANLDRLFEVMGADRSLPSKPSDKSQPVKSIADLFAIYDTAVVLTERGQTGDEFLELARRHADWASVVKVTASEQLEISHELPDHQLRAWLQARIAVFSRYADAEGLRLCLAETDRGQAAAFLDEARDSAVNDIANRNSLDVMRVLESVSAILTDSMLRDAKSAEIVPTEPATEPAVPVVDPAAQQRVYILEDQLSEAEATISELQDRLAKYEADYSEELDESPGDASDSRAPATDLDVNRALTVMSAIDSDKRFPKLRFLTSCLKPLEDYGKPRPNGVEILQALDAINTLAQAWYNTPSGNIGTWNMYFVDLPGWKHADDESDHTMSRFGEKRSFSDQDNGRQVTITRHLTYQGSSGGLQIYFDRDDITETFIVGYIGEHLPYATSRS